MEWLFVALLAVGVWLFIGRRISNRASALMKANNALLAEHVLRRAELTEENPFATQLRSALIKVHRVSGFPNLPDETVASLFNGDSRVAQLLQLSMALNELGISPLVPGEDWQEVRNPFGDVDERNLHAVAKRIEQSTGEKLSIPSDRRFKMTDTIIKSEYEPLTPNSNAIRH